MNYEKEYKVLITKDQFTKLLNCYPKFQIKDQTNYYFDTIPSLQKQNISVRIRELDAKFIFTLKHFTNLGLEEYEKEISEFDINSYDIQEIINKFHIENLKQIGKLHTIRHQINDEYGSLCLDISEYNNLIDYEVEYELYNSNTDHLLHFQEILQKANIKYIPNKISKIQRMHDSLKLKI